MYTLTFVKEAVLWKVIKACPTFCSAWPALRSSWERRALVAPTAAWKRRQARLGWVCGHFWTAIGAFFAAKNVVFAEAKINNFDVTSDVQNEVFQLEISVDDSSAERTSWQISNLMRLVTQHCCFKKRLLCGDLVDAWSAGSPGPG